MNTVSGQSTDQSSVQTDLLVTDKAGTKDLYLKNVRSVPSLPINVSSMAGIELTRQYSHLNDIPLPISENKTVDILIGSDCPDLFVIEDQRACRAGEPYAYKYSLGWSIIGPVDKTPTDDAFTVNLQKVTNEELIKHFSKMWLTDFPDVAATNKTAMSVDDRIAAKIVEDSIKKKNGRYMLKMPFTTDPIKIPNNKIVTEKRLKYLKNK